MPKTFLTALVWIMIELLKYNIYQPIIIESFEKRKGIQLLLLSHHNCFSILSNTSLAVPLVLLCVLFSHCRLCQVVLTRISSGCITDIINVDRVYQVKLEILYSILPSLFNNSQNSLQERSGQVMCLTACKVRHSSCEWAQCWLQLGGLLFVQFEFWI